MNFDFLSNSDYLNCRDNDDFYYFGKIDVPIPSWDEILEEFDREYKIYLSQNVHASKKNDGIFKHQGRLGFILHKCENIKIVDEFLKVISTSHHRSKQAYTAYGYISFSSKSSTHGRHKDVMDVWCWQMTGYTLWKVEGKSENFEKVLEPGELIYIPRGMRHDTQPMTPRAGLSFGSEDV